MNYVKLYKNFVKKCKKEDRKTNDPRFTIHHILPRSMGGLDTEENKVLMTPKEHYIAHRILARTYKKKHPEIWYLLDKFSNGMKGPDSPKYSNFNYYLNQIVSFKKNGKPNNFDVYVKTFKTEIEHLMDLSIDKTLLINKLTNFITK